MKKNDFKKLALLGMAAGSLAAGSAGAEQVNVATGSVFLAHSCGGSCGAQKKSGGNLIAEEDEILPSSYRHPNSTGGNGCGGTQVNKGPTGSNGTTPVVPSTGGNGCGGNKPARGTPGSNGCGAAPRN